MILFDDNSTSPIAAPLVKRRIIEDAGPHTVGLPRATPVAGLSNTHLSRLASYMKSTTASAPGRSRGASAPLLPLTIVFAPGAVATSVRLRGGGASGMGAGRASAVPPAVAAPPS